MAARLAAACALVGCALIAAPATAAIRSSFSCSPDCTVPAGANVSFSSTSTSDSAIRDYAWDLDGDGLYGFEDTPDEPEGPQATSTQRSFTQAGSYTVGLRVRNVNGESSFATKTITVTAPAPAPAPVPAPASAPAPGPTPGPAPPRPPELLPPLASGDEDGDTTPGQRDLCPGTARGMRAQLKGCSLLDAIVSPAALIESVGSSLAEARKSLLRTKGASRPLERLRSGLKQLRLAGGQLPSSPCRGSRTAGLAVRTAAKGVKVIGRLVTNAQTSVVARASRRWAKRNRRVAGDSDASTFRFHALTLKRKFAGRALAELIRVRRVMRLACKSTRRHTKLRRRVHSIDTATGLARLSDGTRLAFGAARHVVGLAPGALVEARGVLMKDSVLVADAVKAIRLVRKPPPQPCVFTPRIAPVQDFSQAHDEILLYDQRGYLGGFGSYQLEQGMGLGAVRAHSCTKDDYALNVFLHYTNTSGSKVTKLIGVLRGVPGAEQPARIPMDVKASSTAKLRFELYGLNCKQHGDIPLCDDEQLEGKSSALAKIRAQGGWGEAVFSGRFFSVEDGSTTNFDDATLKDVDAPALPGASVFGVGYGVSGATSLRPVRRFILEGERFAVHDDVPTQADPGGLLWAYVHGKRNGFPYHYLATLPDIVTDVVSFCPNISPSMYRLPWKAGTVAKTTQGNQEKTTHNGGQEFAFDFKMPKFSPGYATRGGVVTLVEENRTKQSNPKAVKFLKQVTAGKVDLWQPGNALLIKHQDDEYSFYTHMVKGGVLPKEGDVVERGDKIIVVGSTGNVTGPHLHYHVTTTGDTEDEALGNTTLIRFEVGFASTLAIPCKIPSTGDFWGSTNAKPGS